MLRVPNKPQIMALLLLFVLVASLVAADEGNAFSLDSSVAYLCFLVDLAFYVCGYFVNGPLKDSLSNLVSVL